MMRRIGLIFFILLIIIVAGLVGVPAMARRTYGVPAPSLSAFQVFEYSATLLWDDGLLVAPLDPNGRELPFTIEQGETLESVTARLEQSGFIREAGALRDYLIYTGLDTSVQAGEYRLSAAMSIVDMAHTMQDATPSDVTFVVLPGWRLEEIAESLPTSGLDITPFTFISAATTAGTSFSFLEGRATTEGFLYPDAYVLPRTTSVDELLVTMIRNFSLHLTTDLREGFGRQGLSVYQAVTLASIVEREAVKEEEAPMIASVYLNRLRIGMKLDADPTVQYAIGYNALQRTWWTNPLAALDLQIASPYNTYTNDGLPPGPIANPGPTALHAVASPADSPYYFFSARCDASGYHDFVETFEEHLQNLCP